MLFKFVIALLALFCGRLTTIETAKRRFNLEFYDISCKNFTKPLSSYECSFQKWNMPNHYGFHMQGRFTRDIGEEMEVRLWVHLDRYNPRTSVRFIDVKLKGCDILAQSLNNPLLKNLLAEFRRASDFPYMCPIKGKVLYKMTNFTFSDKYLPSYSPFLNFTFSMELMEKSKLFGALKVNGGIVP